MKRGILDVTDDTDFDWNGFYSYLQIKNSLHIQQF